MKESQNKLVPQMIDELFANSFVNCFDFMKIYSYYNLKSTSGAMPERLNIICRTQHAICQLLISDQSLHHMLSLPRDVCNTTPH